MVGAERHIVQAESRYSLFSRETGQRARNHSSTFGVASYSLITLGAGAICPPAGLLLGTAGLVGSLFVEDASGGEPGSGFSPRTTLSTQSAIVERAQMHLATFDRPQNFEGNFNSDFGNFPLDFEIDRALHLNPQRPTLSREDETEIRDQFHTILSEMNDVTRSPNEADEEYIIHLSEVIYDLTGLADYDREQPQMTGLLRGDGGNCEAAARLLVSLFTTSGLLPRGWQVTLQYFDGNENDDPHVQVILYNKDRHVFLNPLSGELTHEENNPLFYPETLDISYLLSRGAEPIRNFNDPALIAYRPPIWNIPTGGINSGSSSGDSSHRGGGLAHISRETSSHRDGALANIPRTGVIFRSGHAPERTTLPSPRLHDVDHPIIENRQDHSTPPDSRVFLGASEANNVIQAIQSGHPFVRHSNYDENDNYISTTIIFASVRDLRRYSQLTTYQEKEDFLKQVIGRTLNNPRWARSRRITQDIFQSPDHLALYSERVISQARGLLDFLSDQSLTSSRAVADYPMLRRLITLSSSWQQRTNQNRDSILRGLNEATPAMQYQSMSFLYEASQFTGDGGQSYFNLLDRAMEAEYRAENASENVRHLQLEPGTIQNIRLVGATTQLAHRGPIHLRPETFYALASGFIRSLNDINFDSDRNRDDRVKSTLKSLMGIEPNDNHPISRQRLMDVFSPFCENQTHLSYLIDTINLFLFRVDSHS
ncbi:MAG: hypothetical protein IPJ69_13595 [Deltaproteobacteria bacterium]|nr:MAG: hypothetical protein IPJ69_13595 [Deltaproteobacteria bacterium]